MGCFQLFRMIKVGSGKQYPTSLGFTLLELMIVMAIAGVVMSGLLSLIYQLLNIDQQENARNELQRELQLALNYITADLREAVFVYDGSPNQLGNRTSPAFREGFSTQFFVLGGQPATPVLAFWKSDGLDLSSINRCTSAIPAPVECQNVLIQRRSYSLVVYLQVINPPNDRIWKGRSRIVRYRLSKYSTTRLRGNPPNFLWNPGFVDPVLSYSQPIFSSWPYRPGTNGGVNCQLTGDPCGLKIDDLSRTVSGFQGGLPSDFSSNAPVLVDFIDLPTRQPVEALKLPPCLTPFSRVPQGESAANSFFSCVSNSTDITQSQQDVLVYLRGNGFGRPGINVDLTLPSLYTRLTIPARLNRNPG